ncbi:GNAT family N-acetyltransferase [Dactylosporangium sp. NPDC000555]|uniref:GNAT family N-acetyltransferase n=1 Tax=Dactylosporangium sp. NPDC000555 TaxID=3154260 RepID=UPI00332720D6
MLITPLRIDLIDGVTALMRRGAPFVTVRGASDYWLYSYAFASTCPVAVNDDGTVIGAVIAMRSQDQPTDVYVQDVAVLPDQRRHGVARALLASVAGQTRAWGCHRLVLTCAPDNTTALAVWARLGFRNLPGDYEVNGIQVTKDFKGPGRDRPVFQFDLTPLAPTPRANQTARGEVTGG